MYLLERLFKLQSRGSNVRTEMIAGATTFVAMLGYVLFIIPNILTEAGMSHNGALTATLITTIVGSLLYSFASNLPISVAPGIGLNTFFTYTVVQGMGLSWQVALGAVFLSGFLFLVLALTGLRKKILLAIPLTLRNAIPAGVGFFIAMVGLKESGIIVAHPNTFIALGDVTSASSLLVLLGLFLSVILLRANIRGALLISVGVITLLAAACGLTQLPTHFSDFINFSVLDFSQVGSLDIMGAISPAVFSVIFSFMIIDLFDNAANLLTLSKRAGLRGPNNEIPGIDAVFLADAAANMLTGFLGSTTVNAYAENTAGIAEGGKTGLTSLVTSVLFILTIPFVAIAAFIPKVATAPILILLGLLLLEEIKHIVFKDFTDTVPALLTILMMPLTFNVSHGLAFGFISYTLLKTLTGQFKSVHWLIHLTGLAFLINFAIQ